jgi:hypothetical protein
MASVDVHTRKPVDDLTLDDLAAYPVWEYATDEEGGEERDESWVRPSMTLVVPQRSYTHVASTFTTPSGKHYAGFVTVSTLHHLPDVCQGVIIHDREQLFVANPEAFGFRESRRYLLVTLGLTEAEVFPLSFRLRIPVAGHSLYTGGALP